LNSLPEIGNGERALGTAQWASPSVNDHFKQGDIWLGRAPDQGSLGYRDDRHVMLVSGSRGGKGTSSIVPNLCLWPGSLVVIDPKGENATLTAARRGAGGEHTDGLDQKVYVLDPFNAASIPDDFRASYNPLDAIDVDVDEAVDEAGRIADAIVVNQNASDPFWDEQARTLIKALILHVVSSEDFENRRNLVTVRRLITSGDTDMKALLDKTGEGGDVSALELLFEGMRRNEHFQGVVSGAGESFGHMLVNSSKSFTGIQSAAANHTEFLDSSAMQRMLSKTTTAFRLSKLKTDPDGVSLFLSLPQRYMNTHFRWLRMMVSLVITEMEKTPGRPVTGFPVLLLLDEFAGLKKLEIVENAAAQIAGFGVKMFFVLQTLTQLKSVYKDNWEVFLANSGTKIFFGVDDMFTREYISKYMGETEISRTTQSKSFNEGGSSGEGYSSTSSGLNSSTGSSSNFGKSWGSGTSFNSTIHKRALLNPDEVGQAFARIDDPSNPRYPGLALVIPAGKQPMIVRRTNYFEDRSFERCFSPHPDHTFVPLPPPTQEVQGALQSPLEPVIVEKAPEPDKGWIKAVNYYDLCLFGLFFYPVIIYGLYRSYGFRKSYSPEIATHFTWIINTIWVGFGFVAVAFMIVGATNDPSAIFIFLLWYIGRLLRGRYLASKNLPKSNVNSPLF
jgi:type IV secretory pathway TraG/TraD family ATPase VirD4/uncharacterized membrane protein